MGAKGFIAGIGFIAAGLAGATQYSGMQTELKVLQGIDKSNEMLAVLAREWELDQTPLLKLEQYEREFLQAKVLLSFAPDSTAEVIQIQLNIDHGPLLWRPDARKTVENSPLVGYAAIRPEWDTSNFSVEKQARINRLFDGKPLDGLIVQHFNQQLDYQLKVSPLQNENTKQALSLQGITLQGKLSPITESSAQIHMEHRLTTGAFNLREVDGTTVQFDQARYDGDMRFDHTELPLSYRDDLSIQQLKLVGDELPQGELALSVQMKSHVSREGRESDGAVSIIVSDIDSSLAPISRIQTGFAFDGMKSSAMVKVMQQVQAAEQLRIDPLKDKKLHQRVTEIVLSELLQPGRSQIKFALEADGQQGEAELVAGLHYVGTAQGRPLSVERLNQLGEEELAALVDATLHFTLDQALLPQAALLLEHPLVEKKEGRYRVDLKLSKQQVTINNQQMSLDEFKAKLSNSSRG